MTEAIIMEIIHQRLGERIQEFLIPPPVFISMQGEFLAFDQEAGILTTRFPVLEKFLNPYGPMQGGMVAAAVDNTLGPLSMLVAPPNVTRRLEMKYSLPVTPDLEFITVKAWLLNREGRWLYFVADVHDQAGKILAKAKAKHWILEDDLDH
jgi:acyl-coenzyme A thioesterase PaaI-like protein